MFDVLGIGINISIKPFFMILLSYLHFQFSVVSLELNFVLFTD